MKKLGLMSVFAMLAFASVKLFADDLAVVLPPPITDGEFWFSLVQSFSELKTKGFTAIGIATVMVQVAMNFLLTPMGNVAAGTKFLLFAGLRFASVCLVVVAAGGTWSAGALSGAGVAALATFAYEGFKVLKVKEQWLSIYRSVVSFFTKKA
jgi:hypothetical protein